MGNWVALETRLQKMVAAFLPLDDWVLVTNYDADGLAAGGIMAMVFRRCHKRFETVILKQLYPEHIPEIREKGKHFFFIDLGAGQLDFLKESFGENFWVLDHHQPLSIAHLLHANPLLFGFDGGHEVSASGMAFWFARAVSKKNEDLAGLAVVGALGDMQDETGELIGLNREIAEIGIQNGVLERKLDLRLYGRISRPLTQFLCFASSPVLPELTANEKNCIGFMQDLGIDLKRGEKWVSYEMLSLEEKRRLSSALIVHLHQHHLPEWKIQSLIGEVYSLLEEEPFSPVRDAKEFATLLNATGRHSMAEIGLQVCLGDRNEAYSKALSLLAEHRKQLREGIQWIQDKGVEEKSTFYFFDAEDQIGDSIVGIVAGMLYGSGTIGSEKPIIALARYTPESIKVSGRGTQELVRRGLNLGAAFRAVCEALGGGENTGGGHKIAAGCKVELKNKALFLELLEKEIAEQLGAKRFFN